MALKPFLNDIRKVCSPLNREELIELIARLAAEQAPDSRGDFVLKVLRAIDVPDAGSFELEESELLAQIGEFREDCFRRQASGWVGVIDDDDKWYMASTEEPLWDEESGDAEGEFKKLLDRVGSLFVRGRYKFATKAYGDLLECTEQEEESFGSVDLFEVKARYYRALLETAPPKQRARRLAKAMLQRESFVLPDQALEEPLLLDIVNAAEAPISDLDSFLKEWKQVLRPKTGNYAKGLYLEALELTQGVEALKEYALRHQEKDPTGFMWWIDAEKRAGNYEGMKQACLQAIQLMTPKTRAVKGRSNQPRAGYRVWFIELLAEAADTLGDDETLLLAKRELAAERATNNSLRDVLREAERRGRFETELNQLNDLFGQRGGPAELIMKIALLRGDWEQAKQLSRTQESSTVAWIGEDECIGLYMTALMAGLCGSDSGKIQAIKALLSRYADQHEDAFYFEDDDDPAAPNAPTWYFTEKILAGLERHPLPPDQWGEAYRKAETMAERWLHVILEGRRRNSYDRAAEILAALAETLTRNGDRQGAEALVHQYTKVHFPRLSGFRKALERLYRNDRSR